MNHTSRLSFSRKGVALGLLVLAGPIVLGVSCGGTEEPPAVVDPNSGLTGDFVGSERCFTCHSRTHGEWAQTRHHESYNTLVALGQETNSVCLTCHTTGYGLPGGFQTIDTTELLAHVGCESCHGAAKAHVQDVSNKDLRPEVSVKAEWCSRCHNGFHHDTYTEWSNSGHGHVTESVAEELHEGLNANNCGTCHSGDVLLAKGFNTILPPSTASTTVVDALLAGVPVEELNGATCSVCHDPHRNTGNAVQPPAGHDLQLRFAEIANPDPANATTATTDPTRFNVCGQCHHDRGRDWTTNSRPPHHSVQANFYVGEMPSTEANPLVPNQRSTHRFVEKQCVTCHMQHEALLPGGVVSNNEVSHPSHSFTVASLSGCVASGCHPSEGAAQTDTERFQAEVQNRLNAIIARMGPVSQWGFSSAGELPLGGPPANKQSSIHEGIRKARWLWAYVSYDGSLGVHNPPYTRAILTEAERLLTTAGK